MQTRIDINKSEINTFSLKALLSFDKPGEQKLFISIKSERESFTISLFLDKEETKALQEQINNAVKEIGW